MDLRIDTVADLQKAIQQVCLLASSAAVTDNIGASFNRYLRRDIRSKAYFEFSIPKKSGGERIIIANVPIKCNTFS